MLADLSLATRLTMVTLIPTVAFMTVGGPAMGSALFAYGHFGDVDAGYLGTAIALSAFTLLPYAVVLLQLRVFYAREQPWIPIAIIVVITIVKIAAFAGRAAPDRQPRSRRGLPGAGQRPGLRRRRDRRLLPAAQRAAAQRRPPARRRRRCARSWSRPPRRCWPGWSAYLVDVLTGMQRLTAYGGGAGSLLRLVVLAVIMLPIVAVVMVRAQVPEAVAALAVLRRWIGASPARGKPAASAPPAAAVAPFSGRSASVADPHSVARINCCAPASSRTLSTAIRPLGRTIRHENPSGGGVRSNQPGRGQGGDRR